MTTVGFNQQVCKVCGTKSAQVEMGMRSLWKPYELDGRPSDSYRSSLYMMMQRCISCGYCSQDISRAVESAAVSIASERYKKQLADRSWPDTATAFMCASFIAEDAGDFSAAGTWAKLATWICEDDRTHGDHALIARHRAIAMYLSAREKHQHFAKGEVAELLLLIDMMRRCGNFDELAKLAAAAQELSSDETERALIQFQLDLVEDGDFGRHTIAEAMESID